MYIYIYTYPILGNKRSLSSGTERYVHIHTYIRILYQVSAAMILVCCVGFVWYRSNPETVSQIVQFKRLSPANIAQIMQIMYRSGIYVPRKIQIINWGSVLSDVVQLCLTCSRTCENDTLTPPPKKGPISNKTTEVHAAEFTNLSNIPPAPRDTPLRVGRLLPKIINAAKNTHLQARKTALEFHF